MPHPLPPSSVYGQSHKIWGRECVLSLLCCLSSKAIFGIRDSGNKRSHCNENPAFNIFSTKNQAVKTGKYYWFCYDKRTGKNCEFIKDENTRHCSHYTYSIHKLISCGLLKHLRRHTHMYIETRNTGQF